MCGVSGFVGIPEHKRFALVHALGDGIDTRGGHAAGFVTVSDRIEVRKRIGHWSTAHMRFIRAAASAPICLMHARYATCGSQRAKRDPLNAHPFTIRRNGKSVLYGAHNGVIYNADESAALYEREYTVDSKEILELLADDELDTLQSLDGYGVLTWIEASDPHSIKIAKLSEDGEIVVARVAGGGVVYASTQAILGSALAFAKLVPEAVYTLNEVGRVYAVRADGVYTTKRNGVKVADWRSQWTLDDEPTSPESYDRDAFRRWLEDEKDEDRQWLGGSWDAE